MKGQCHEKTRYQSGFTLTELILVMIITGILAATAAPKFIDSQIFESRGFYEEVLASLRYAQKMAVGTGCQIQVSVTTLGTGTYSLQRETNAGGCDSGIFGVALINPRTNTVYPTTAPNGAAITNVVGFPITFDRLGRAITFGATVTATLDVGDRTITVWAETGLVTGP